MTCVPLLTKNFTTKMASRRRKVILILPPTLPPPTIINIRAGAASPERTAIYHGSTTSIKQNIIQN